MRSCVVPQNEAVHGSREWPLLHGLHFSPVVLLSVILWPVAGGAGCPSVPSRCYFQSGGETESLSSRSLLLYFLYVDLSSWWIWWCMNLYRPLNVYLLWYFTHYVCMVRQGTWCSPGGRCSSNKTMILWHKKLCSWYWLNSLTCPDGVQTLPTGFSRSLAVLISIDRPSQLWSVSRAETMMAFLDLFSFLHENIECLWETRRLRGWLWISHYFGIRVLGFQCPLEETVTLWYCQN